MSKKSKKEQATEISGDLYFLSKINDKTESYSIDNKKSYSIDGLVEKIKESKLNPTEYLGILARDFSTSFNQESRKMSYLYKSASKYASNSDTDETKDNCSDDTNKNYILGQVCIKVNGDKSDIILFQDTVFTWNTRPFIYYGGNPLKGLPSAINNYEKALELFTNEQFENFTKAVFFYKQSINEYETKIKSIADIRYQMNLKEPNESKDYGYKIIGFQFVEKFKNQVESMENSIRSAYENNIPEVSELLVYGYLQQEKLNLPHELTQLVNYFFQPIIDNSSEQDLDNMTNYMWDLYYHSDDSLLQ